MRRFPEEDIPRAGRFTRPLSRRAFIASAATFAGTAAAHSLLTPAHAKSAVPADPTKVPERRPAATAAGPVRADGSTGQIRHVLDTAPVAP